MAKGKAALGRGLGALLPDREEEPSREGPTIATTRLYDFQDRSRAGSINEVRTDAIRANPYQPRTEFDESAMEELADSIRQLGIIQPVTVRAAGDGEYELIAGERRLRAARLVGLETVPAFVREADTEAMLEMAIVENVQREELNPIEVALGYQRLIQECELTQEEVATKVGKGRATITNLLRLLKLPVTIQAMLRDGNLTTGHARALVPIEETEAQEELARQIVENGLSVRSTEDLVKKWLNRDTPSVPRPAPAPTRDDLVLRSMTDRLRTGLGTKVAIRPSAGSDGGKIEIEYYSSDDLERLIELMGN